MSDSSRLSSGSRVIRFQLCISRRSLDRGIASRVRLRLCVRGRCLHGRNASRFCLVCSVLSGPQLRVTNLASRVLFGGGTGSVSRVCGLRLRVERRSRQRRSSRTFNLRANIERPSRERGFQVRFRFRDPVPVSGKLVLQHRQTVLVPVLQRLTSRLQRQFRVRHVRDNLRYFRAVLGRHSVDPANLLGKVSECFLRLVLNPDHLRVLATRNTHNHRARAREQDQHTVMQLRCFQRVSEQDRGLVTIKQCRQWRHGNNLAPAPRILRCRGFRHQKFQVINLHG